MEEKNDKLWLVEQKVKQKMWYRGFVYLLSLLDRINHKKTIVLTMLLTHHIVSINNTKHNSYRYKILKKKKFV